MTQEFGSVAGALAQIRLNLASVEQFASIACGLADDNPRIRQDVHEAAEATRRAGQLVDHLRSLFAHQHAIECERRTNAPVDHSSLCFVGGAVIIEDDDESLRHFSWANQLTLVRAAKSLVANVAKILYLTQEMASSSTTTSIFTPQSGEENLLMNTNKSTTRTLPPSVDSDDQQTASDRLDNVANYSQLLRSFGKLSIDLLDLGTCIMWARKLRHCRRHHHHHHRDRRTRGPLAGSHVNYSSELEEEEEANQYVGGVGLSQRGRGSVPKSPMAPAHSMRPSSSMLFPGALSPPAQPLAHDYIKNMRATHHTYAYASHAHATIKSSSSPATSGGGVQYSTYTHTNTNKANNNPRRRRRRRRQLEAQIQDMQILFQVNRLIIERSILLLLNASKCCLAGGRERQFGLEARHSIGIQIRVSISIIMALVKCSVFGCRSTGSNASTTTTNTNESVSELNNDNEEDDDDDEQSSSSSSSPACSSNCSSPIDEISFQQQQNCNNIENVGLKIDNNQVGNCSRLPLASLNINSNNNNLSCIGDKRLPGEVYLLHNNSVTATADQLPVPMIGNNNNNSMLASTNDGEQIARLFNLHNNNNNQRPSSLWPQPIYHQQRRPPKRKLTSRLTAASGGQFDFMNYFLLTPNGTLSAHDAIYGLQSLVEPFKRVANQDKLAGELDQALAGLIEVAGNKELPPASLATGANVKQSQQQQQQHEDLMVGELPPVVLMNKRQLVRALNLVFLGQLKATLVERLHEFTDCAYTKHESRETIVALLACLKLQLNKFVRLIYRLRRRSGSLNEPNQLAHLRQVAAQLEDTCAELNYELKSVAVEQSDELDRTNSELELVKQLKHLCLVGDVAKVRSICVQFSDQTEQLIEICKLLNQVAPSNKLKISTKVLITWFSSNLGLITASAHALALSPLSRQLKDCAWAQIQIWSSFYDDFCQLARQLAYLVHSSTASGFGSNYQRRKEVIERKRREISTTSSGSGLRRLSSCATSGEDVLHFGEFVGHNNTQENENDNNNNKNNNNNNNKNLKSSCYLMSRVGGQQQPSSPLLSNANDDENDAADDCCQLLASVGSAADNYQHQHPFGGQQQQQQFGVRPTNDSPRSLDHYHGFGPNYRRSHDQSCAATLPIPLPAPLQLQATAGPHSPLIPFSNNTATTTTTTRVDGRHSSAASFMSPPAGRQHERLMSTTTEPTTTTTSNYFVVLDNDDDDDVHGDVHRHANSNANANANVNVDNELQRGLGRVSSPPSLDCLDCQVADNHNLNYTIEVPALRPRPPPPPPLPTSENSWSTEIQPRRPPPPPPTLASLADDQSLELNSIHQRRLGATAGVHQRSRSRLRQTAEDPDQLVTNEHPHRPSQDIATSGLAQPQAQAQPVQQQVADSVSKWSADSEADAIVRGARETAQMALSMYQFTRGEGDLNTTQDLFTQAELFAEEANELYKEVRCFSYKVPAGDLKKELLFQLSTIPALVQQLQFTVKNPTVGKAATFAKVDSVIRETKSLMEAVNRVVEATLSCRQHYNMATSSLRKRTRTLSPSYRNDRGSFEFDSISSSMGGAGGGAGGAGGGRQQSLSGTVRHISGSMGSEPDI